MELQLTVAAGPFDRDLCPVRVAIPGLRAGAEATLAEAESGKDVPARGLRRPGHDPHLAHWVDCVQNDREPVCTGEEGRASLEIILAGYQSSAERHFVELRYQTW